MKKIDGSTVSEKYFEIMKHVLWSDIENDWHNVPFGDKKPEIICLRTTGRNHSAIGWGKYNLTNSMYDHKYMIPDYCNGQVRVQNFANFLIVIVISNRFIFNYFSN